MRPIVDGLQGEYGERLTFQYLNAADGAEGQAAFESFDLRGHPSILLVSPQGDVLWNHFGVIPEQDVRDEIERVLAEE